MKQIASYSHTAIPETQLPDTQPGNYYVSIKHDDGRWALLSGPYVNDHAAALALVRKAADIARQIAWSQTVWASFGTARMDADYTQPGRLQTLGYDLQLDLPPTKER